MYLADSGNTHGDERARISGAEVTMDRILQSAINHAIHGKIQVAKVKKRAMDMLATKVLHFGPTYSNTIKQK